MKRRMLLTSFFLLSVVIAVFIHFSARTLPRFILGVFVSTAVLFWALIILRNAFTSFIDQHIRVGLVRLLGFVGVLVLLFVLYALPSAVMMGTMAVVPDSFHTNILTGNCVVGGGGHWEPAAGRWYLSEGCDTVDDKIYAMQQRGLYEAKMDSCISACEMENVRIFCSHQLGMDHYDLGIFNLVSCDKLMTCETLVC